MSTKIERLIAKIRKKFPKAGSGEAPYCVGGAFMMYNGVTNHHLGWPGHKELAAHLVANNPKLAAPFTGRAKTRERLASFAESRSATRLWIPPEERAVTQALFFADQIMKNNDDGHIKRSWKYLERALAFQG